MNDLSVNNIKEPMYHEILMFVFKKTTNNTSGVATEGSQVS